jgi:hypothetical protein
MLFERDAYAEWKALTLEAIRGDHCIEPDLLKVDIEGIEYEFFTSGENFLRNRGLQFI